ncbi:MAG: hypothetical protein WAM09_16425 [Anaerolineales bacterium]
MKDYRNDKLIKRNSRLGQVATISGLLVLIGGMFVSFRYPTIAGLAWVALLVGFALSQIGLYFGNRWGRHPRPDELIDQGLKGLNEQYTLYHYLTPAAHLLVGPAGIWVLVPYHQVGKIIYEKGRWKQKGGGFMQRYLRAFAQEGIGRPDLEVPAEVDAVAKHLEKWLPDKNIPKPQSALVFTSDKVELAVEDAPIPTLPLKKLKETIRKSAKEHPLSPELIQEINSLLYS